MKVAIVGLGLIGGSIAKSLKEYELSDRIIGVDANPAHGKKAQELGLVDEIHTLEEAIPMVDLIVIATPVNTIADIILDALSIIDHQTIIDVGSTKEEIIAKVNAHPKRSQYVATHPMAGTEYSGPEAAISELFRNKYVVICNPSESDPSRVLAVSRMFETLGMKVLEQDAKAHDTHVAYVSHISHISSFALAITVLNKEVNEEKIFELASTGFSSTVRLAKSLPATWVPIFEQNRDNVLEVLDEHIRVLSDFRSSLIKKNYEQFHDMICEANKIKKIIK